MSPASELVATIAPPPRRCIAGIAARVPQTTPSTFTRMIRVVLGVGERGDVGDADRDPGVQVRDVDAAELELARGERVVDLGRVAGVGVDEDPVDRVGDRHARPSSKSTQQIRAPSAASRVAVACPMPDAAPVISATLPSSCPISSPVVDVARTAIPALDACELGRSELDDDQALLGHLAHRVVRAFLGVAAVLHAAVGHLVGAERRHLVHGDATEVELVRGPQRGAQVVGEDRGLQPVAAVVRQREGRRRRRCSPARR